MAQSDVIIPNNLPVSDEQRQSILIIMETHDFFAKKQITNLGPLGTDKYSKMWTGFAKFINDIGPAVKTEAQWQTYWTQMRLDAKKTMSTYLYNARQTGNNNTESPSDEMIQISQIFGTYGVGMSLIPEVGIYNMPSSNSTVEEELYLDLIEKRTTGKTKNILCENHHNNDCHFASNQDIDSILNGFITVSSDIVNNFLKKALNWMMNIEDAVNPQQLTMQIAKSQLNFIMTQMKKKHNLAKFLLSKEEISSEWITLAEILNVIGPSYEANTWMEYWRYVTHEVEDKRDRIKHRQSRAKLTDEDLDILNILNGSAEDLISIKNTGKMRTVTFARVAAPPGLQDSVVDQSPATYTRKDRDSSSCGSSKQVSNPPSSIPSAATSSASKASKASQPSSCASQSISGSDYSKQASTSGKTSQKALHERSIEAISDSNTIITTLAGHLKNCFEQHTKILENALNTFNQSVERLVNQIVLAFLNDNLENTNRDVQSPIEEQPFQGEDPEDMDEDYPMVYYDENV